MDGGYFFRRMTSVEAREVYGWRYEGAYSFYDMSRNPEDFEAMVDPEGRERFYSAFGSYGALAGFFSFIDEGDGELTVGLGLEPGLTGRGLGETFVRSGLEFGRDALGAGRFGLSVATFNRRAIKVYERIGFRFGETFMQSAAGAEQGFLRMTLS